MQSMQSIARVSTSAVSRPRSLVVTCSYGTTPKIGGGKRWEHIEVNENGKPVKVPMHIKKGDTVQASVLRMGFVILSRRLISMRFQIIAGKDKGTVGLIKEVLSTTGKCVVEGVNIKVKHIAPRSENEKGQIRRRESPVHHSNVMLYSTAQQVRSRVGYKFNEEGKKVRYLVKTGEIIS